MMRRSRRDPSNAYPDFDKLAYEARRKGARGKAALQVLQDALMIHYGPQLEAKIKLAQKQKAPYTVVFIPQYERYISGRQKFPPTVSRASSTNYQRLLEKSPFNIIPPGRTPQLSAASMVVWDSREGFDVHSFVAWRRAQRRSSK